MYKEQQYAFQKKIKKIIKNNIDNRKYFNFQVSKRIILYTILYTELGLVRFEYNFTVKQLFKIK